VRVQRGINCGSDHYVVRGRTSNTDKHDENYKSLRIKSTTWTAFNMRVRNIYIKDD